MAPFLPHPRLDRHRASLGLRVLHPSTVLVPRLSEAQRKFIRWVPGEAVFFNEELALSFGGVFGSCSKLSVTNLRVIAQKSETIFFGTCSVTSPTAIGTKQLRVFCFRVVSRTHSDMPSRSFAHIITHLSALNLSCPIRKFLHVSLWALISMKMLKRAETASLPDATSSLL